MVDDLRVSVINIPLGICVLKIFLDYVDGKKSEDALMQEINT